MRLQLSSCWPPVQAEAAAAAALAAQQRNASRNGTMQGSEGQQMLSSKVRRWLQQGPPAFAPCE